MNEVGFPRFIYGNMTKAGRYRHIKVLEDVKSVIMNSSHLEVQEWQDLNRQKGKGKGCIDMKNFTVLFINYRN